MRIPAFNRRVAMACGMVCTVALVSCTNSDYDLNEIDSTVGIGGDELRLPVSSTDTIQLSDVLDLDDTECVRIDETTKEYVFEQSGNDVEGANPRINVITVSESRHEVQNAYFSLTSGAKPGGKRRAPGVYTADDNLNIFSYRGDKPETVVGLLEAEAESEFKLTISFSQSMKQHVTKLDDMTLRFPAYMVMSNVTVDGSHQWVQEGTSQLKFTDVNTSADIVITGDVHKLDFTAGEPDGADLGSLKIEGNEILLDGKVHVTASFGLDAGSIGIPSERDFYISSALDLNEFTITGATGYFDPEIDLHDLGDTEINDVPDFLTDGNVVIDLYNPMILLDIESNLEIDGYVKGRLKGYKDGAIIDNGGHRAEVEVPEILIRRHNSAEGSTVTHVCICRNAAALPARDRYDVVKEVDNLSDIIRTIPDRVTFEAEARADRNSVGHFALGREDYGVTPAYRVSAPLAFASDARIVYTDSIDDWNGDIEDLELSDGSYVQLETSIENRVPLYLTLKAEALGTDGKLLGSDKVSVEVDRTIIASTNGKDSERTPVVIRIKQNREGALKELDGLLLTFEGDASLPGQPDVTGITLNSEKHFIIAHDVKIKLVGTVIADLN